MRKKIVNITALVLYGFLAFCIGGLLVEKANERTERTAIEPPQPAQDFWGQFADAPPEPAYQPIVFVQVPQEVGQHRVHNFVPLFPSGPSFEHSFGLFQQEQALHDLASELRWIRHEIRNSHLHPIYP